MCSMSTRGRRCRGWPCCTSDSFERIRVRPSSSSCGHDSECIRFCAYNRSWPPARGCVPSRHQYRRTHCRGVDLALFAARGAPRSEPARRHHLGRAAVHALRRDNLCTCARVGVASLQSHGLAAMRSHNLPCDLGHLALIRLHLRHSPVAPQKSHRSASKPLRGEDKLEQIDVTFIVAI